MRKKDILELKKRLKKDHCTFTRMCGCYVNAAKHIIMNFRESFLNLEEEEYFKFLEISKKVLSGTIGNNILQLSFPTNETSKNERQASLLQLKSSALKNDAILDSFYKVIIDNYDYTGNYLIILFHDIYDVITKTTDNVKIDESEEVYEYILCAICPVSLSDPGLRYFEEENKIKARIRDWVVEAPINGFVFPAFIERSADIDSIMYYTKNAKDTHPELMENVLGCYSRQTATIQKETFQSIIKSSFTTDEAKAEKIFMEVQENLNIVIDEHNSIYDDTDIEPKVLTPKDIQNILIDSGISEELTLNIEKSFVESFGDDLPLAEHLIDPKTLKANEQRKKEENLQKQVDILQTKLELAKGKAAPSNMDLQDTYVHNLDKAQKINSEDNNTTTHYDVILQVKPEKISQIKAQIIDGQKCIVIPINDNEQTTVNGLDDLI